ncbi:Uncharacterized protein FKW44_017595, partial [Caligus rogercresseyi]
QRLQGQDPRLHQEGVRHLRTRPQQVHHGCHQRAGVSNVTLLACVNEDLHCHSYKLKVGQLLTQKNKNWPPSSP